MGKLVRDRIPEIRTEGRPAKTRFLDDSEYETALLDKLAEEVKELRAAAPDERLEEAADVYEVLGAMLTQAGLTHEEMIAAAATKRSSRGGFEQRVWLESW